MFGYLRVLIAFLVAPMIIPMALVLIQYLGGEVVFWEFFLGVGLAAGYGFALALGLPAYLLYFRRPENQTLKGCFGFAIVCSLIFFVFWSSILVSQDGPMVFFSTTLWGYGLIFLGAALISVALFYLIAFHRLST